MSATSVKVIIIVNNAPIQENCIMQATSFILTQGKHGDSIIKMSPKKNDKKNYAVN